MVATFFHRDIQIEIFLNSYIETVSLLEKADGRQKSSCLGINKRVIQPKYEMPDRHAAFEVE
jgi:hypothetical protein